jgi:hypothetical protein
MNTNNAHLSNQINVTVQFPENQQFCWYTLLAWRPQHDPIILCHNSFVLHFYFILNVYSIVYNQTMLSNVLTTL